MPTGYENTMGGLGDIMPKDVSSMYFGEPTSNRKLRLDITCTSMSHAKDHIEKNVCYFGALKKKTDNGDIATYLFNTSILVDVDGLAEEGTTRIILSKKKDGKCNIQVYTKAVPGNGGLSSIRLDILKQLEYT